MLESKVGAGGRFQKLGSQGNKARSNFGRDRQGAPMTMAMPPGGTAGLRPVATSVPLPGAPPQLHPAAPQVNGRGGVFGKCSGRQINGKTLYYLKIYALPAHILPFGIDKYNQFVILSTNDQEDDRLKASLRSANILLKESG